MPAVFVACDFAILKFRQLGIRASNIGVNLNTVSDKGKKKIHDHNQITTSRWPSIAAEQAIPLGKCSFGSRSPGSQEFKSLVWLSSWWCFLQLIFHFLKTINRSKTHRPPKPFIILAAIVIFPLLTFSKHFKETDWASAFHCDRQMSHGTLRKRKDVKNV